MIAKNNYIHTEEIHNTKSADAFLPFLKEYINPQSVIDVGCGLGTWLKVFVDDGCNEILGVDGNYIDKSKLCIKEEYFLLHDLTCTLRLDKKYDLAICSEVAEHLPEDKAEVLIDTLINASDTILFSAALPLQGGQNHVNEQPFAYWVQKFNDKGFVMKDYFREKIWDNSNIDWWYKQNLFLVVRSDQEQEPILDYYHPARYLAYAHEKQKLSDILQGKLPVFGAIKIFIKSVLKGNF